MAIKYIAITIFDNAKYIIYNGLDDFSSKKKNCFNLFGFDILIDKSFKCWLLEINSTPDLSGTSSNCRKTYDTDFNIKAHLFAELLNIVFYPELPHAMPLEKLGNFEEATQTYKKGCEFSPNDLIGSFNLANCLLNLGKFKEALEAYDKCIQEHPYHISAYNNKGATLQHLKQYSEAIKCYQKCIELSPKSDTGYSNLGYSYFHIGKYNEAIECYNKSIELNENDDTAFFNKGVVLEHMGELREALTCFTKCVQINPKHTEVKEKLVKVAKKLRKN